ncbi:hypothetical protein CDD83_7306 [Cordyceps sp. RAO-2017]|nr:hypothetical protein CDD83_7306 [Cordyceps sp. RAO-2017]
MPQALKAVICDWLSTTFDCRVSKIMLGTKTLISVWESWISAAGIPSKGPDFILTITFNAPVPCRSFAVPDAGPNLDEVDEPGLRSLEITIASSDLGRFLHAGQAEGWLEATQMTAGLGEMAKSPPTTLSRKP